MYNTIIFDVDGTLIDTENAVIGSLQKMLEIDHGIKYESHELYFVLGIPGVYSLKQLGVQDIPKSHARWEHFMKDFYHTIEVFGGITNLLVTLKKRDIKQGVVTSKTSQEVQDDFAPFGLMDYLTHVVCADDTLKHKPNPEPLLKYLEISGANPKSSIYIGDTVYDYECARDAGVDFGLALWGCKNHDSIPAKYKFEQPNDMIRILTS
jgi:HAD superfamily hydrolase (TIGR01549 family)